MPETRRPARRRPLARRALAAALLGVALGAAAPPAHGHAALVRSSPAARASLARPPARAQLWFSERLEAAYSSASVWTADGARMDPGDARVEPDDPTQLSVGLPALVPGRYTIRFRVLSVDGHLVESSIPFTVKPRR